MNMRHFLDLFNVAKDWRLFAAMIRDKRYKIPLVRKLIYAILIIYIIIPFDFIPGFIPLIGMVDDLGAFAVILGAVLYEIASYRDFREGREGDRRTPRTDVEGRISEGIRSLDTRTNRKTPK